jgi:hypothetical protein
MDNITENLYQEDPSVNVYEYILEDGDELSLSELIELNRAGYVYHSQLTDVDFEDEHLGVPYMRTMNIYYFSKAADAIHEHQIPA